MNMHTLHCLAICLSLAQSRHVSVDVLPDRPAGTVPSAVDAYDFAPYIEVQSPLFRALIDRQSRCCVWITYRVRAEDVEPDNDTERGWWMPDGLDDYCVPSRCYVSSGWDRGHLRSIQMSRGSSHWPDCNALCVIVPQRPELNRGPIAQLESDICDLAETHGWCQVTITLTGDVGDMPRAGSHQIPQTIRYVVESPAGVMERTFQNGGE